MFDLLSPTPTNDQKGEISLQEDSKGNLTVKGLTKHIVNNEEEAFNLLFEGEANRTISEHQLNKESTRSHCIFTIYLEMKSRIESSEKVITSKLNFVDLAGSERVKKTGSTGVILKEANYINKSLTFLEQVVVSLTDKKKSKSKEHVPYRQSKLTHLLKDSIGGNCRTVMIATMWPEYSHLNETLSTLNFARRMMNVLNEACVNIQLDTQALLRKYGKEIKELKQELAMHNTLANRGRISYDQYTPEEQYAQQMVIFLFFFIFKFIFRLQKNFWLERQRMLNLIQLGKLKSFLISAEYCSRKFGLTKKALVITIIKEIRLRQEIRLI